MGKAEELVTEFKIYVLERARDKIDQIIDATIFESPRTSLYPS